MRKTSRTLLAALVGAILIAAACNDDPMGLNSGDELTQAEIDEVFAEIFDALGEVFLVVNFGGPQQLAAGPFSVGPVLGPFSETFDETGSCALGGTVRVTGSVSGEIDEQAQTGTFSFNVTETISNCVISTATGTVFTVNTSPLILMTGDFSFNATFLTATLTITGGFAFTGSDGRSGTCLIAVEATVSITETTTEQVSVTGTACGRSITDL